MFNVLPWLPHSVAAWCWEKLLKTTDLGKTSTAGPWLSVFRSILNNNRWPQCIKDENGTAHKAQVKIIAFNCFVSYYNLSQCCI